MTPQELIKHYGGELQAAIALDKDPITIKRWVAAGKIEFWNQAAIETISKGKLRAKWENKKNG